MRNDKATAPIIQGTETMDEYSSFVACFLYTVLIFVFLQHGFVLAVCQVSTYHQGKNQVWVTELLMVDCQKTDVFHQCYGFEAESFLNPILVHMHRKHL